MRRNSSRASLLGFIVFASLALVAAPRAPAATKLVVGKAAANADPIIPVDIGYRVGIFKRHGFDLKIVNFTGGSKMVQGMTAGAIDIGIGAGTEMAFVAKGAPMIAVCEAATTFPFLGIGLPAHSPIRSLKQLKGKTVGISSPGSLTDWLTKQLSTREGWGPNGIKTVAIGNAPAGIIAAFRAGQVDADIGETALFLDMELHKVGRLLVPVSAFQGSAASGTIYASNKLIRTDPAAIRRFLAAWLDTLNYIRTHKAETLKIKSEFSHWPEAVESKDYDLTLSMYTKTCRFDPEALRTLQRTFVDLKLLPKAPDMSKLYTEAYLPK